MEYEVQSNLTHNGRTYEGGESVSGDQFSRDELQSLVDGGVLVKAKAERKATSKKADAKADGEQKPAQTTVTGTEQKTGSN